MLEKYYEYIGVIHIHSKYSDGSGTIKKIVKDATKSNLNYIIISDHNNINAMKNGMEGWHNNILVLVGEEIGSKKREHYLALRINKEIKPDESNDSVWNSIEAVKHQGGIGFVAHPVKLHNPTFGFNLKSWKTLDNLDFTGIEIWSYMYDWSKNLTLSNILYSYFHPEKSILGPPNELIEKWDQLCQKKRVVGIGGADVHAKYIFPIYPIKFLSYKKVFRGIRTHILTPSPLKYNFQEDKNLVYNALEFGHCFFAHDFLADSTGFRFEAFMDNGQNLIMGDESKLEVPVELKVSSPVPASILLFKDGYKISETEKSLQLIWRTNEIGVYRVEARYNDKPWVFTNPIYLR